MTREIALSRGLVALVDDEDFALVVAAGPWHAAPGTKTFYARHQVYVSGGRNRWLFIHSLLLGPGADHVDGDGLNNTRANLRPATLAENARNKRLRVDNTSGYKGVSWHKAKRSWSAQIGLDGRCLHLGQFPTAADAAAAYDAAAIDLHGAFAQLNFPRQETAA